MDEKLAIFSQRSFFSKFHINISISVNQLINLSKNNRLVRSFTVFQKSLVLQIRYYKNKTKFLRSALRKKWGHLETLRCLERQRRLWPFNDAWKCLQTCKVYRISVLRHNFVNIQFEVPNSFESQWNCAPIDFSCWG